MTTALIAEIQRVLDRQARETSAPASAESARDTSEADPECRKCNGTGVTFGGDDCMCNSKPCTNNNRKGEPAAEAQGGALTDQAVVSRLRQEDEVLPGFLLGNDKALALVAEYGRQRSADFIANLNVQTQTLAKQLGERDAELAQLRAQLAQRPDARLREAARKLCAFCDEVQTRDLAEDWPETAQRIENVRSALAADPAPQVEREGVVSDDLYPARAERKAVLDALNDAIDNKHPRDSAAERALRFLLTRGANEASQ